MLTWQRNADLAEKANLAEKAELAENADLAEACWRYGGTSVLEGQKRIGKADHARKAEATFGMRFFRPFIPGD